MIQIVVFTQQPDWDEPWNSTRVNRSSGTGFVIDGKRIMTNAHVVTWAKQIQVRRYQDSRPFLANVAFIGHDCDLAILEVEETGFFDSLEPLALGELPEVRSTVVTYGYPAGGEQISYTSGVVSRIELQTYTHPGNRRFLAVQTDAAINQGNSGGPVIQDGKVVGVSFQGIPRLENTGFFIPPPIIYHFLKDVEDGAYDGFPQAGIRMTPLQNRAQRNYLGMPPNFEGARIDALFSESAKEHLRKDDVLLQVGDYPVAQDGSILYEGNQLHAGLAFSLAQSGEKVPVTLWRDRQEIKLELPVHVNTEDAAAGNLYELPRYYVYAGMVFTPLTKNYLSTFGQNWAATTDTKILYELFYRRKSDPENTRTETVMLASTLAHPVNANMRIRGRVMVDEINGVRIDRLEDVIRAFDEADQPYHTIKFTGNYGFETVDHDEADTANQSILRTYGIVKDRHL
ncbi:MAG: putative serine protease HhoA [Verrucomicrobia subdivision 3 bacterium]|nr:putative serine protease HhoA [Limisphaerales bacterium]MCS1414469.1 putative serine protease HhoA [Limisphaerales bacterium]